jgi:peptide-methionine (S)-S-oxide reductase
MADPHRKTTMPTAATALPGRPQAMQLPDTHFVSGHRLSPPFPAGLELAHFGMGCFWGAERLFWGLPGVWSTSVGYAGGFTPNPTYAEVCSGDTGHAEVVRVVFDPGRISYAALLKAFWENHDPTQGMRQGIDVGTQYRSVIHAADEAQLEAARASKAAYVRALGSAGHVAAITTEIAPAPTFFYAEDYHQQYLAKNPDGECGLGGTGVTCPAGLASAASAAT